MSSTVVESNPVDVIKYARPFEDHVLRGQGTKVGKLQALFRAGPSGAPYSEDDGDVRFYTVDVSLHSPKGPEIDAVEYSLDPTFYDPIRYSDDRDNDFTVEIQTYGDFELTVTAHIGKQKYVQKAYLSALLANGYGNDATPAVKSAIKRIIEN